MGVLDELKQEAQAIEAEKARETTSRAEQLARVRERVAPAMDKAYTYFNELKQHLQVVNREIEATYDIRDAGRVEGLKQGQYGVSTENPQKIEKFSFRFVCAKSGVIQVNQADVASAAAFRDYLRASGMQAKVRDSTKTKGGSEFMVQPAVPVVVEFTADMESGSISLRVRNLSDIGVSRYTLTPEQVDEKFLDEMAKAVLRQPNRFDELTGNTISEEAKRALQKKIQATMRQKALAEEMEKREAAQDRTITKRFARTFLGRDK